ncbi:hypothetical protein LINPERHAP1_LOCUS185 [Linum perenne]
MSSGSQGVSRNSPKIDPKRLRVKTNQPLLCTEVSGENSQVFTEKYADNITARRKKEVLGENSRVLDRKLRHKLISRRQENPAKVSSEVFGENSKVFTEN